MRTILCFRCLLFLLPLLAGCESPNKSGEAAVRLAQGRAVLSEKPGAYFIGRRYYDSNYKFWGYVRQPGQPWREAKLVMLNEKQKLAPDREINQPGSDDNAEYRLTGYYSGEVVYEPVSDRRLPEFVLTGYELRDRHPPSIFAPGTRKPGGAIPQPD